MATSEAHRRAQATYRAKQKEAAKAKVTLYLEADEKAILDRLAVEHGSIPKAVSALLKAKA